MPNTSAPPAAICFDLDDTLIDDAGASAVGLRAVMERLSHPDFGAAHALWHAQTEISLGSYLRGHLSLEQQRRERIRALAVQAGHKDIADQHCDELHRLYRDAHRTAWGVYPDTFPTLSALSSAGYRLAVLTNGIEAIQHEKLRALELTPYFTTVVCADTAGVGQGKPDPDVFHLAAQHLGVDPAACWHVGDQVQADGVGAVASQMHPVLIDRQNRQRLEGITTISALNELPRLLGLPHPAPSPAL